MSNRVPVAKRARCGMDTKTTEVALRVPRLRAMTVNGIKGVWVPLHPLAQTMKS